MIDTIHRFIVAGVLFGGVLGCHAGVDDEGPSDRRAELDRESVRARRLVIEHPPAPERIEALARHLEGLADVHAARVKIHPGSRGTVVEIELAGVDLPSDDELLSYVADEPGFESAVARTEPMTAEALIDEADHGNETPDQIRAKVEADLRAQGVEGDVDVVVEGQGEQRRVEVRVERREPPAAGAEGFERPGGGG